MIIVWLFLCHEQSSPREMIILLFVKNVLACKTFARTLFASYYVYYVYNSLILVFLNDYLISHTAFEIFHSKMLIFLLVLNNGFPFALIALLM